jgi:hypothetical protein
MADGIFRLSQRLAATSASYFFLGTAKTRSSVSEMQIAYISRLELATGPRVVDGEVEGTRSKDKAERDTARG